MDKEPGKVFGELKENISTFAELKLELLKLSVFEHTGKVVSVLAYGLILLFLGFFATLFVFIALGFFLGDLLGNIALGFALVAILYFILICLMIMLKTKITDKILNMVIAVLLPNDNADKTNSDEHKSGTDTL